MKRSTLLLLALPACWLSDAEIIDKFDLVDVGTDIDSEVLLDGETTEVLSVDPSFGSRGGGTEVTIEVDEIGPDLTVRFGSVDAEIISASGTTVVARTPAFDRDGAVNVDVSSGGSRGRAPAAFTYWDDADGQFSAVGAVLWVDYKGDLEENFFEDTGQAWLTFVAPTDDGYGALYGRTLDMCQSSEVLGEPDWDVLDLGLSSVALRPEGAASLSLTWDDEEEDFAVELTRQQYLAGVDWSLPQIVAEGLDSGLSMDVMARTPRDFNVTEPDFSTARGFDRFGDNVSRSFTLEWTTQETGDYAIIQMLRYGPASDFSSQLREDVRCLVVDDGSFTVPMSAFFGWDLGYEIDVYVSRVFESGGVMPHSGGRSGVVGTYRVAGSVWQSF